jgi:hypothetical protein
MKKYLTLIAGALMMAACSNDDATTEVTQSGDAIGFSAVTGKMSDVTRAAGEINDETTMQKNSFGVFGFYTGQVSYINSTVTPDYMWNQKMEYSTTKTVWNYAPVKYWPNEESDKISFFAYAPYQVIEPNHPTDPADLNQCIFGMSRNVDKGDPWINYRMAKNPWGTDETVSPLEPKQIDLLYGVKYDAATSTYSTWTDQSKEKFNLGSTPDKIVFNFQHALACVADKVTLHLSDELKALITGYSDITINKLTIEYKNMTYKARLVLNPDEVGTNVEPNWKEIISGELVCDRKYTSEKYPMTNSTTTLASITPAEVLAATATTPITVSEGQGLFYIPLQIAGTPDAEVVISIDYTVTIKATSTTFTGTATNSFKLKEQAINKAMTPEFAGKKLGIALTLGKDFDLMHEVWVLGGTAYEPSYSRITK